MLKVNLTKSSYMLQVKITNKLILKLRDILQKSLYSVRRTHIETLAKGDYFHIPLIKDISGRL
jgi:hypothetical protein